MLAKQKFDAVKALVQQASKDQDANLIVHEVPKLGLNIVGESNYMLLNCEYEASDSTSLKFHYHSYDPSGPFQNIPDINKVKIELFNKGELVEKHEESFDDKR
jgi:hypothetical protein